MREALRPTCTAMRMAASFSEAVLAIGAAAVNMAAAVVQVAQAVPVATGASVADTSEVAEPAVVEMAVARQ